MVARIDHAFETIRTEFDSIQGEVHTLRAQRDELESKGEFPSCFTAVLGYLEILGGPLESLVSLLCNFLA